MFINSKIVTNASCQNKKVPDCVMKKEFFPGVKNQTETVEKSTSQKQL